MSADNGVYTLVTRGSGEGGREYRSAYAQAIENIFYKPDYPEENPVFNREYLVLNFGSKPVRTDRNEVIDDIARERGNTPLEYGVQTLEFPDVDFPT